MSAQKLPIRAGGESSVRGASGCRLHPCDHPDFPLHIHPGTGQWYRKIKGVQRSFGSAKQDPTGEQAWERYKREKAFWEAGIDPRAMARNAENAVEKPKSVLELCDRWLVYRLGLVTSPDPELRIDRRTYDESKYSIRRFLAIVDELASRDADPLTWPPTLWEAIRAKLGFNANGKAASPSTKGGRIVAVRMMCQWAVDNHHIPRLPHWASSFHTVSQDTKDEHRYDYQQQHGERVFDLPVAQAILQAVDNAAASAGLNSNNTSGHRGVSKRPNGRFEAYIVRRRGEQRTKHSLGLFDTAEEAAAAYEQEANRIGASFRNRMIVGSLLFRACTYLAANTGAYSKDIAAVRFIDLELADRYLERKRTKTKALWQAILWPETVDAIKEYLAVRPEPAQEEYRDLVFLSSEGQPVNLDREKKDANGNYSHTNRKDILKARMRRLLSDLGCKDKGLNFGAWRHTFRSLASSAMGLRREDLERFDAINRTMAHRIPGSANNYVHLRREQLKPVADIVRGQLWPEKVAKEREAAQLKAAG